VSEVGFMMEDERLQLLIRLFSELKTDVNDLKTELKNDIKNCISAVRGNLSALETKIKAGQEESRQEISDFQ
jgi:sensor domain CHASE-containing protein